MKKILLTENKLNEIITESIKKILKEGFVYVYVFNVYYKDEQGNLKNRKMTFEANNFFDVNTNNENYPFYKKIKKQCKKYNIVPEKIEFVTTKTFGSHKDFTEDFSDNH